MIGFARHHSAPAVPPQHAVTVPTVAAAWPTGMSILMRVACQPLGAESAAVAISSPPILWREPTFAYAAPAKASSR